MNKRLFFLFALVITCAIYSCKDENESDDMMVVDESVDITAQIIGSYTGTNKFGSGGSFFTEEDRTATITRLSDSTIRVNIFTFFGDNISIVGDLSSETQFSTSDVIVLDDEGYAGTGTLNGNTINIDLSTDDKYYEFVGQRQ